MISDEGVVKLADFGTAFDLFRVFEADGGAEEDIPQTINPLYFALNSQYFLERALRGP